MFPDQMLSVSVHWVCCTTLSDVKYNNRETYALYGLCSADYVNIVSYVSRGMGKCECAVRHIAHSFRLCVE